MLNREHYTVISHLLGSLDRYAEHGIPCGDFLNACLCNDFMEAVGLADDQNRFRLHLVAQYIYNEMPSDCHGSREKVAEWIKQHESKGVETT